MKQDVTHAGEFDFNVCIRRQGSVGLVFASGEIDLVTADHLEESIVEICDQGVAEVVVDLRGVTFMDCSGVKVLLGARRRADDGEMGLTVIPSASVNRILEILKMEQLVQDAEAGQ